MNRRPKQILIKIFFNPYVIALPFSLITILLIHPQFNQVVLEPVSVRVADKIGKNTIQYYHDLNNDSIDEEISHFTNDIGQCAIKVRKEDESYFGQWNFNGFLPDNCRGLLFLDLNNDKVEDIITVYQRMDSVFIGGVSVEVDDKKMLDDIFVDRVNVVNGEIDFSTQLSTCDLNMDGIGEVIINISAGYSEQPRRIYAYDFANNLLTVSPIVGFSQMDFTVFDLDNDGFPELIPKTISYENIEENLGIPYHDYNRWFVVYNHELEFEFGPYDLGDGNGYVEKYIFENDSSIKVFILDVNNDSIAKRTTYLFDLKSGSLQEIFPEIDMYGKLLFCKYEIGNQEYLLVYNREKGCVDILDPADNFGVMDHFNLEPGLCRFLQLDVNGDGKKEALCSLENDGVENLIIYADHFKYKCNFHIPAQYTRIKQITTRSRSNKEQVFVLQLDEKLLEFRYGTDKFYLVKTVLLYLFIYGFYFGLIWVILFYQRKILKVIYTREQQLAELKLKSIRSQLDPHFTFNAINAIASAIMKEDKDTAYAYFSKFSQLMRSTMLYSDRMTRLLDDELNVTKQYLDVEKFRFRDKFTYEIHVDSTVNINIEVPRMIIQTFAESAVSNGLMHRPSGGKLQINVTSEGKRLIVNFVDNGVGIESSKRLNKTKAFKAVRIMDDFIKIFNDLNHVDISYKMHELDDGQEYPGTAVEVSLPLVFKYKRSDT